MLLDLCGRVGIRDHSLRDAERFSHGKLYGHADIVNFRVQQFGKLGIWKQSDWTWNDRSRVRDFHRFLEWYSFHDARLRHQR
jgi:hypothetical protein